MGKQHIPEILSRRVKKNRAGAATAALAVSFVLLAVLVNVAIGRYQHRLDSEGYARALEFYFTSDFLDGGIHTLAPGSTQVSFTVGNHADELRFSEVDIDYTVKVEPGDGVTVEYGNAGKKLAKGHQQDDTVTIKALTPGRYTVTAVGTAGGYSQTLSVIMVVPAQAVRLYQHQDNVPGEYILLTVWNEGDQEGTVTIAYTGIPDNTNPNMTDWSTGGSHDVTIAPHESKVFRFFSGTVTVTGATEKAPS